MRAISRCIGFGGVELVGDGALERAARLVDFGEDAGDVPGAAFLVAVEPGAGLGHLRPVFLHRGEDHVGDVAVAGEMGAAGLGDGVDLLVALGAGDGVAGFLEVGQRRVDDAGARAVGAVGTLLQGLDDVVAVARLLGEQGEDDQAEVAVTEHAPGTEWSTGTAAETRTKRAWAIMGRAAEAAPAGAVRVEGQLMEFESSLRVVGKDWTQDKFHRKRETTSPVRQGGRNANGEY